MSDVEASNALVSVVRFYSDALARETLARQQVEAALRNMLSHPPDREDPQQTALVLAALAWKNNEGSANLDETNRICKRLHAAIDDYQRSRNEVDRVEPTSEREGSLRGAPADGEPDLPRPDR